MLELKKVSTVRRDEDVVPVCNPIPNCLPDPCWPILVCWPLDPFPV